MKIREFFTDSGSVIFSRHFARVLLLPLLIWTALVAASLFWNLTVIDKHAISVAKDQARGFFKQMITTRLWNANHGGVYVPITAKTQPNPYLELPERDVETLDGVKMTLLNPAYMTRQISEVAEERTGLIFHLTSINPLRPENEARAWEAEVLKKFSRGEREFMELTWIEERPVFRYMAPLVVKLSCMKCHSRQGYRVGDIRGGISIVIPAATNLTAANNQKFNIGFLHFAIYLLGLFGIIGFIVNSQLARVKIEKGYQLQNLLNSLLKVTLEAIPIEEILDRALDLILSASFIPTIPKGCIFVTEDNPDVLVLKVQRGMDPQLLENCAQLPFGDCVCGTAASFRKIVYAAHMDKSHEHRCDAETPHGHYCVPIISADTVIGLINVYLKDGHRQDQREEEFLKTVANTLAGIMERKKAEEELKEKRHSLQRYADELKMSNEELKSFAYIVSHDLRAPLINIKGFSGELRYAVNEIRSLIGDEKFNIDKELSDKINTLYSDDIDEALDFINSSSNMMDTLITAILQLSRIGRQEMKPEPVAMDGLVNDALMSLAHQIEKKKVNVTVGELPEVIADRTSMKQIIGNLLDNAIKYLDRKEKAELKITSEQRRDERVFHVTDNGPGIEKGDQQKIFEIFRRSGKQAVPGEGMGLAYVKTLVRRHGGHIWCESEPGSGSTFSFSIPDKYAEITQEKILQAP